MMDIVPIVAAEGGLANGLDTLSTIFSFIGTCVGNMVNVIAGTPLLLLPVGIFVFGAVIGLSQRFIGR